MLKHTALTAALALACAPCSPMPVLASPTISVANEAPWLTQPADPVLSRRLELAFQAFSAADIATTCASGKLPGVEEEGAVAVALYGHRPTCRDDALYGLGRGALHFGVTALLKRFHAPNWLMLMWQVPTVGSEAVAVSGNVDILAGGHGL